MSNHIRSSQIVADHVSSCQINPYQIAHMEGLWDSRYRVGLGLGLGLGSGLGLGLGKWTGLYGPLDRTRGEISTKVSMKWTGFGLCQHTPVMHAPLPCMMPCMMPIGIIALCQHSDPTTMPCMMPIGIIALHASTQILPQCHV